MTTGILPKMASQKLGLGHDGATIVFKVGDQTIEGILGFDDGKPLVFAAVNGRSPRNYFIPPSTEVEIRELPGADVSTTMSASASPETTLVDQAGARGPAPTPAESADPNAITDKHRRCKACGSWVEVPEGKRPAGVMSAHRMLDCPVPMRNGRVGVNVKGSPETDTPELADHLPSNGSPEPTYPDPEPRSHRRKCKACKKYVELPGPLKGRELQGFMRRHRFTDCSVVPERSRRRVRPTGPVPEGTPPAPEEQVKEVVEYQWNDEVVASVVGIQVTYEDLRNLDRDDFELLWTRLGTIIGNRAKGVSGAST